MGRLIYLSPSNHGKGQNPCLKKGCYEDKHTRPIAEAASRHLKASGFDTIIGRVSQNMAARCAEADRKGAALYVPIHTNASKDPSVRYLMFMCYGTTGEYRKLFTCIAPCLEAVYPGREKAEFASRPDLVEINTPNAKTFYCEMGFHTNEKDCAEFIHSPEAIGKGLAKGICEYYGVKFKAAGSSAGTKKTLKTGSRVKIKPGAKDLNTKKPYSGFVYKTTYTVISISGDRVVFGLDGKVTGATSKSNITLV